jgi:hypothetical protein
MNLESILQTPTGDEFSRFVTFLEETCVKGITRIASTQLAEVVYPEES